MGSFSQEPPDLLPVLSVMPESAVSAGFRLASALALDVYLALDLASSGSVLPAAYGLPIRLWCWLASLASSVETLRKAMVVPASSRSRLASMPTPTRSGTTSCMRRHSQRADLGQALSRTIETPISSAMLSSFLCNSVDEPRKHSRSSMNLMMA